VTFSYRSGSREEGNSEGGSQRDNHLKSKEKGKKRAGGYGDEVIKGTTR